MDDDEHFHRTVEVCSTVISMGMMLVGKKGMFGGLKATDNQIGWCVGFCDAATQDAGFDDAEWMVLTALVFETVFAKAGKKYLARFVADQAAFTDSMIAGGQSFQQWVRTERPPLPPLA